MAHEFLSTVTLDHLSGFADDAAQNTFAWSRLVGDGGLNDFNNVVINLSTFYNIANINGKSVSQYLSPSLSRLPQGVKVDTYSISGKLGGAPHGPPVNTQFINLSPTLEGGSLPSEVALVLTLNTLGMEAFSVETPDGPDAGVERDRPRSRRRGRLYIGPFSSNTNAPDDDSRARPIPDLGTTLRQTAKRLHDMMASDGLQWSVWSRKDAALRPISGCATDNAWDTQRRRGVAPTSRTTTIF